MDDWLVSISRGTSHSSVLVRGDIQAWLTDKKAKPTKDPNRFTSCGWRLVVSPLSDGVVPALTRIFDRSYEGQHG